MQKTSNTFLVRKLQSVGMGTFIKYYYLFKTQLNEKSNEVIFAEFMKNKEPWNDNSFSTKASQGKSIFKHRLEKQALEYIIHNTNKKKIGLKLHEQAISIFNSNFK